MMMPCIFTTFAFPNGLIRKKKFKGLFELFKGLDDYAIAVRLCPQEADAYRNLVGDCLEKKMYTSAAYVAEYGLNMFPNDQALNSYLVNIYDRLKRYAEALDAAKSVPSCSPKNLHFIFNGPIYMSIWAMIYRQ